jgi:hypothetical protein
MRKEIDFYVVGKSENEILAYDELRSSDADACFYFTGNSLFFIRYTLPEAERFLTNGVSIFPDLVQGMLNIYHYGMREEISLLFEHDEVACHETDLGDDLGIVVV